MSPRFQARLAGAIAWITTTSALAIFVRAKLVVAGDAAATAHNIRTLRVGTSSEALGRRVCGISQDEVRIRVSRLDAACVS